MTGSIPKIARFYEVFHTEFKELRKRRARSMLDVVPADVPHPVPSVGHGFTGIALSGGGVRSAVFSLGVLQGLQSKRVVDCADYLSTVSGGGYIGTALTLGMSTNGSVFPFGRNAEDPGETPEVQHLRDNSRYLLQNGVSSAVSALAIYLRGIVMNLIVVLPFLLLGSAALIIVNPDTAHLSSNNFFVQAVSKIPTFAGLGKIIGNFAAATHLDWLGDCRCPAGSLCRFCFHFPHFAAGETAFLGTDCGSYPSRLLKKLGR